MVVFPPEYQGKRVYRMGSLGAFEFQFSESGTSRGTLEKAQSDLLKSFYQKQKKRMPYYKSFYIADQQFYQTLSGRLSPEMFPLVLFAPYLCVWDNCSDPVCHDALKRHMQFCEAHFKRGQGTF